MAAALVTMELDDLVSAKVAGLYYALFMPASVLRTLILLQLGFHDQT